MVPHLSSTSGGHLGQNGQKLDENDKINIFWAKQGNMGGKPISGGLEGLVDFQLQFYLCNSKSPCRVLCAPGIITHFIL